MRRVRLAATVTQATRREEARPRAARHRGQWQLLTSMERDLRAPGAEL